MKKITVILTGYVIVALAGSPALAQGGEGQEPGAWDTAGQEVKEASHAVGEASRETWEGTKKSSAEAWDKARTDSVELYIDARESSRTAWEKTKKASSEAWHKTKTESHTLYEEASDASKEAWKSGKAKIHEATAPDPDLPAPVENFTTETSEE